MKSFVKTTTKTYNPLWIRQDFSIFSEEFENTRKRFNYKCNSCIKCNHRFNRNESISLACFDGIGNKVLCSTCGKELSNECA